MDEEFAEVHDLLKKGDYDMVIFPSDANGVWPGSGGIFKVAPVVIAEIMKRLQELKKIPKRRKQVSIYILKIFPVKLSRKILQVKITGAASQKLVRTSFF